MTTEVRAPSVPDLPRRRVRREPARRSRCGILPTARWSRPRSRRARQELERATVAAVEAFERTKRLAELRATRRARPRRGMHRARRRGAGDCCSAASPASRSRTRAARSARGALTFRTAAEEATAHQRRVDAARLGRREPGAPRDRAPLPDRPRRGHQPVQLPAQPGRPQGGAGHRGRVQHRAQAPVDRPAQHAPHRRATSTRPTCRRAPSASCRWIGRPATASSPTTGSGCSQLHRLAVGRLEDEGRGRQEEGRPRARRQRRRHRRRDADLDWAVERLVYGSFAYAGQVCISVQRIYVVRDVVRGVRASLRRARRPREGRRPARSDDRSRADGRREGGRAHPRLGDRCAADGARALVARRAGRSLVSAHRPGRRAEATP